MQWLTTTSCAPLFKIQTFALNSNSFQAHASGIGRHSQAEVEKMGCDDLSAVSTFLGTKDFLFGSEPTSVDCAVFGLTVQVLYVTREESVYRRLLEGELVNLKQHCERMKERYWKDWEECKYKDN